MACKCSFPLKSFAGVHSSLGPLPHLFNGCKKVDHEQECQNCLTGLPATRLNKATLSSAILESARTSVHLKTIFLIGEARSNFF